MNKCGFIGRMGKDPKFYAAQGQGQGAKKALMTFSLAVKRPGGQKDQQGNVITDWLDFTAFGKTAELLNQYCPTGSIVAVVDATAVKDSYQDKTGQNRTSVKFLVGEIDLEVTFAASKGNGNGNANGGNNNNNNNNYGGQQNNANQFNNGRQAAPPVQNYQPSSDEGGLPF